MQIRNFLCLGNFNIGRNLFDIKLHVKCENIIEDSGLLQQIATKEIHTQST